MLYFCEYLSRVRRVRFPHSPLNACPTLLSRWRFVIIPTFPARRTYEDGMSNSQGSARPYFRTPTISPDGAQVAFVYAGDIWLVSIEGGDAERLTANPAG